MKTRNAFTTLTICLLSELTIPDFVNLQKVAAESTVEPEYIKECRNLVTGTYLTALSANFGTSRGITTFTRDGNFFAISSIQSGVPNIPPFSNTQGRWRCISDREIVATGLNFNYSTATVPSTISRSDLRATFDLTTRMLRVTSTLRTFDLNANPLKDSTSVQQRFTVTGVTFARGLSEQPLSDRSETQHEL